MNRLEFVDNVAIVGCGGIGSWLMPPLLRLLNAAQFKGEILLWDGDKYEDSNLKRQDFEIDNIGLNKAVAQLQKFLNLFPDLKIDSRGEYITNENVDLAIKENGLIFTCVDNHPARARIDKHAATLRDICVISAGNEMFDGNVTITLRRNGDYISSSLLERHPEIGETTRGDRADASCEELFQAGNTQLLVANLFAAASAVAAFHMLNYVGEVEEKRKQKKAPVPQDIYFDASVSGMSAVMAGKA